MELTETLSLLSLLFVIIFAVGGVVIKMQRNDEKHSNKTEALLAMINVNKEQDNKDITAVDKKVDTVMSEFRTFVTKHFETEASNNKEIMQKMGKGISSFQYHKVEEAYQVLLHDSNL